MSFRLRHTKSLLPALFTALFILLAAPASFPEDAPAQTRSVFGPESFTRTSGSPKVYSRTFAVPPDVIGPYTLSVQNGDADGGRRHSSASIILNGVEVVRSHEFKQNVFRIEKEVSLHSTNDLVVRLKGAPGGDVTVTIWGTSAGPPPNQSPVAHAGPDHSDLHHRLLTGGPEFLNRPFNGRG